MNPLKLLLYVAALVMNVILVNSATIVNVTIMQKLYQIQVTYNFYFQCIIDFVEVKYQKFKTFCYFSDCITNDSVPITSTCDCFGVRCETGKLCYDSDCHDPGKL